MQGELNLGDNWQNRPKRPALQARLFFGIVLDPAMQEIVDACRTGVINDYRLTRRSLIGSCRFHISLHHLGDYPRLPSSILFAAERAGAAVSMPPFEVTLHSVRSFEGGRPDRKPLVLIGEGEGLTRLHTILGACLARNGLSGQRGAFTPHLTLLYNSRTISEQPIEPIRFVVRDFVLIHSKRGLSEYEILQRWTLH
ncbi:2'-5' RNA ligase family protein [Phyllobacterium sp. 22229]|uniref:2'-5' RNA ligase family protein n=1 Tax=Phyllobacterium sp. 22229 TaxID=3453895 RepID=UPI003F872A38